MPLTLYWRFVATGHQRYREHLSRTTRCATISSEEGRGYFGYSWVPWQEQQSEGSWSEGFWNWAEHQRRQQRGRLPPPQWCQPWQGPLQAICLTLCLSRFVHSDTLIPVSSLHTLTKRNSGDFISVLENIFFTCDQPYYLELQVFLVSWYVLLSVYCCRTLYLLWMENLCLYLGWKENLVFVDQRLLRFPWFLLIVLCTFDWG